MHTALLLRYERGIGALLGKARFSDGRVCCVWGNQTDIHDACKAAVQRRYIPVFYEFKTSPKGTVTLTSLRQGEHAGAYDAAREADEARGRLRPNSYEGRKLAQAVKG